MSLRRSSQQTQSNTNRVFNFRPAAYLIACRYAASQPQKTAATFTLISRPLCCPPPPFYWEIEWSSLRSDSRRRIPCSVGPVSRHLRWLIYLGVARSSGSDWVWVAHRPVTTPWWGLTRGSSTREGWSKTKNILPEWLDFLKSFDFPYLNHFTPIQTFCLPPFVWVPMAKLYSEPFGSVLYRSMRLCRGTAGMFTGVLISSCWNSAAHSTPFLSTIEESAEV